MNEDNLSGKTVDKPTLADRPVHGAVNRAPANRPSPRHKSKLEIDYPLSIIKDCIAEGQFGKAEQLYQDCRELIQMEQNDESAILHTANIATELIRGYSKIQQSEKASYLFEELKLITYPYLENYSFVHNLILAAYAVFEVCRSSGQWKRAEQMHEEIELAIQYFPNDRYFKSHQLAKIEVALTRYYGELEQWQRANDIYQKLRSESLQHPTAIPCAYNAAEAAKNLIMSFALQKQSQVEQLQEDLQEIAKRFPKLQTIADWAKEVHSYISLSLEQAPTGGAMILNQETALKKCEEIFKQYNIRPEVLQTNDEFYSDAILVRTIQEKKYFISAESPHETSIVTSVLIRQAALRNSLMHSSRVEKATQNTRNLAVQIDEIKNQYSAAHHGKEPSLNKIAQLLTELKVASPGGKDNWHAKTVKRIVESPSNTRSA